MTSAFMISLLACILIPFQNPQEISVHFPFIDLFNNTVEEDSMSISEIETIPAGDLRITVIYDNTAFYRGLQPDWGFACVIEGTERTLLFDTGADSDLLFLNMNKLACHPREIETVVISHEHWDHVDGLEGFLRVNPSVRVFLLDSFSEGLIDMVSGTGAEPVRVSDPAEICRGIYSTGTMGSDPEEQAMIIVTDMGVIVITGCAHPGIVEIVRRARELTGREISLVMGGFHLRSCSDEEMDGIIAEFREMGVMKVAPCHCTGEEQIEAFSRAYGEDFIRIGVGRVLTSDLL